MNKKSEEKKHLISIKDFSGIRHTDFVNLNKNLCHNIPFIITESVINKRTNSFTVYNPDNTVKMKMSTTMDCKMPNVQTDGLIFFSLLALMQKNKSNGLTFRSFNDLVKKLGKHKDSALFFKHLRKERLLQGLDSLAHTIIDIPNFYLSDAAMCNLGEVDRYVKVSLVLLNELTVGKDKKGNTVYRIELNNSFVKYADSKFGYTARKRMSEMATLRNPVAIKLYIILAAFRGITELTKDAQSLCESFGIQREGRRLNHIENIVDKALKELESKTEFHYDAVITKKGVNNYTVTLYKK